MWGIKRNKPLGFPRGLRFYDNLLRLSRLESWTSCYERLTEVVTSELSEVLDETSSEILSLLLPLASALVSVAWVEDSWVNARELCRNCEVEVRDLLSRSAVD